jgi:hypothetical protein
MFWVVTEICAEHNLMRRMRAIKQFIKVARQCKECKNFNSMFNIISGLGHGAVSRLKQTWEKLPGKYQRLFRDMQDLMDPSRKVDSIQKKKLPHPHGCFLGLRVSPVSVHLSKDKYLCVSPGDRFHFSPLSRRI